jgi:hypothetical protein
MRRALARQSSLMAPASTIRMFLPQRFAHYDSNRE